MAKIDGTIAWLVDELTGRVTGQKLENGEEVPLAGAVEGIEDVPGLTEALDAKLSASTAAEVTATKPSPIDADELILLDSEAGGAVKKTTTTQLIDTLLQRNGYVRVGPTRAALVAACAGAVNGQTLVLSPYAVYVAEQATDFHITADVVVEGNNATIKGNTAFWQGSRVAMKLGRQKVDTGLLGSMVAVTAGQDAFAVPAEWGYTPAEGDIITFCGNEVWQVSGDYRHGMIAVVTSVSGLNITLDRPFYESFNVRRAICHAPGKFTARNLHFDLTDVPAGLDYLSTGLLMVGASYPTIDNVSASGNDHAKVGIQVHYGQGGTIRNPRVMGFWNSVGTTGGGRLGYGVNIGSNSVKVIGGGSYRCKHAVTGGPREYKVDAYEVDGMSVMESLSDLATSVGGSLDAHAGVIGSPIFQNNKVWALKAAFNLRNGYGIVKQNRIVRVGTDATALLNTAGESPFIDIDFSDNELDAIQACIVSRTWGTTEACSGVKINRNRGRVGGYIWVSNIDAELKDWAVSDNEVELPASTNAIDVFMLAGGRIKNFVATGNRNTFSGGRWCRFSVVSNAVSKQPQLNDVTIEGNRVQLIAGTAQPMLTLDRVSGDAVTFQGNIHNHSTESIGVEVNSCSIKNLSIDNNKSRGGQIRFGQSATTGSADTYENLSVRGNKVSTSLLAFGVAENVEDIVVTGSSKISGNTLRCSGSVRAYTWAQRAGSTAWAASDEVQVSDNTIVSLSGVGVVQISANSTGHKLLFRGNALSAPIEDLSGTYYGLPLGNTHRTGTQAWRGGTTWNSKTSRLRAAAAPTTGTWEAMDVVDNNAVANSAGSPIGWVCVTAGTPGTWRPYGVTA